MRWLILKLLRPTSSILISIIIHAASIFFLDTNLSSQHEKTATPIEISKADLSAIVFTESSHPETPTDAKFLSDKNNNPKKQIKAKILGTFSPGGILAMQTDDAAGLSHSNRVIFSLPRSPDKLGDDIEAGDSIQLRTSEYSYAGFFLRVKQELYGRWVRELQRADIRLRVKGVRMQLDEYKTDLRWTINRSGELTSIELISSSDVDEFDSAAKSALWSLERVPNPPHALFNNSDEFTAFDFSFTVDMNTHKYTRTLL